MFKSSWYFSLLEWQSCDEIEVVRGIGKAHADKPLFTYLDAMYR